MSKTDEERDERESRHPLRAEGGVEGGWIRIGRYDRQRRRALWSRIVEQTGPPTEDGEDVGLEAIELCAGREGSDAFVRVTPDNPIFGDLFDCIARAEAAVRGELFWGGAIVLELQGAGRAAAESDAEVSFLEFSAEGTTPSSTEHEVDTSGGEG